MPGGGGCCHYLPIWILSAESALIPSSVMSSMTGSQRLTKTCSHMYTHVHTCMYLMHTHMHTHVTRTHTHTHTLTSLRWKKWKNPVRGADCPCLLTALKREISQKGFRGFREGSERGQRVQRVQRGFREGSEGSERVQRGDRGFREGSEGSERVQRVQRGDIGFREGSEGSERVQRVQRGFREGSKSGQRLKGFRESLERFQRGFKFSMQNMLGNSGLYKLKFLSGLFLKGGQDSRYPFILLREGGGGDSPLNPS